MEKLTDIYSIYSTYKTLCIPYEYTQEYEAGIISESGHILLNKETMTAAQEEIWNPYTQMVHKLKEGIAASPSKFQEYQRYVAALFLVNESSKIGKLSALPIKTIMSIVYGPQSDKYLREAAMYREDMAAPTMSAGSGQVAGIGVGPQGEPGVPRKFAGCRVFGVNPTTFQRCLHGKMRYEQYKKYVGSDDIGEEIRQYGRKNPKKGIILMDTITGSMLYLRRPKS